MDKQKIAAELVRIARELTAKGDVPPEFKEQWKNDDRDGDGKKNEPKPDFLKKKSHISREIHAYNDEWVVPPEHLIDKAVRIGLIDRKEARSRAVKDAAYDEAVSINESYAGSGQGFGSSDMNHAIYAMFKYVKGIEVDWVNNRITRVARSMVADERKLKKLSKSARRLVSDIRKDGIDKADERDVVKLQKITDTIQDVVSELPSSMNTIFFTFATPPKTLKRYMESPEDKTYGGNFKRTLDEIDDVLDFLEKRILR